MPAESHPLRPPGVSGEASQLPWQCQARELERLAGEQSATTRNLSQPQRSTACLRRRHLHSRCEPAVHHRLEAETATHSQTSIVDLLEHKSLNIIHELRPLVNKLSVVAQVLTRPSPRLSRPFGRPSLHHPSRRTSRGEHPGEPITLVTRDSPPSDAPHGCACLDCARDWRGRRGIVRGWGSSQW
jgi:hypothetical protein